MGWETRRGRRYYYRKIWVGDGTVKSVYCGSGERGETAAREDEERRAACAMPPAANIGDIKKEPPGVQHINVREEVDTSMRTRESSDTRPDVQRESSAEADTPTRAGSPTPFEVAARLGYYRGSYGSASRRYSPPARRYRPPRS